MSPCSASKATPLTPVADTREKTFARAALKKVIFALMKECPAWWIGPSNAPHHSSRYEEKNTSDDRMSNGVFTPTTR